MSQEDAARLPAELAALCARGAALVRPKTHVELGLAARPVEALAEEALSAPVGCAPLSVPPRARVVVLVSDATRDEPRMELFRALRSHLARVDDARISLVVASGTHAPRDAATVIEADVRARHPVHVHDGHDPGAVIDLGRTSRGTRVRVARVVAEADVIVTTGRIRPHYFAGMSGGVKSVFPGCALAVDARQNHLHKADPRARLGRLDDNPCRLDMEEAARLLPGRLFMLNVVADCDGAYTHAFAGDVVDAHRAAARAAAPLFEAEAGRARVVVASDLPPVTDSLYQASKLLPPVGAMLREGGVAIMVAACPEGTGPLQTVNEGIYRLGVRHHLPRGHAIDLVSSMDEATTATTYARHAPSLAVALARAGVPERGRLDDVAVAWRAGELVVRARG
ncbi:MAG: DUF2088 domain-containing protein [Polyangiaceae bacterium]|nr:DUF2088 domain-containing protein [Polyangiaceae bacterium]